MSAMKEPARPEPLKNEENACAGEPSWQEGRPLPYINRELSWLAFNRRVLSEAENPDNPVLERVKFLSITASNLDEFFMVRFASLRSRMLRGDRQADPAGLTPGEQVRRIAEEAHLFMDEQTRAYHGQVLPALRGVGLAFLSFREWSAEQARWVENCCRREILPKISCRPLEERAADRRVAGRAMHLGALVLDPKDGARLYAIDFPQGLPRVWWIPKALGEGLVLLEDMVSASVGQLFSGRRVLGCFAFRITRDADFTVPDDATGNLILETKKSLRRRRTGDVVRLEVQADASPEFVRRLMALFRVEAPDVYFINGPLNLAFLLKEVYGAPGYDMHRYVPFTGKMPAPLAGPGSIFQALREGDVLLHHPYDSFDAVLRFVREAAADPRVLAIKMTLYRVSGNSPVIRALCGAAEAGKQVTVLLEVKARFDEENNMLWGEVLERAGCHVIYGLPQVKTHSKIALVVRREGQDLMRYVHLGTGNYNDVTAKQYTDMGLFTCDPLVGEDAQAFFNMITGFSREPYMHRLIYAPRMLRRSLTALIETEIRNARQGKPAVILAKMNSLVDKEIIRLLYEAGMAGVRVELIVRGVCCLRPGIPGVSDRITVRSIIGQFLEHSRVFRFENGGEPHIYLSSADWMPRNLNRRVELMFPLMDARVRARVEEVLALQLRDTSKAWEMERDGTYRRVPRGETPVNAQELLFKELS